ncbi:MAG: Ig-like domain-containing protein [Methylococcales bacterium]|nr:Ig-like domain-containing protein [Methylococcales bacterium]
MSTTTGTNNNDSWSLTGSYSGTLDGLDGVDTLGLGTLTRSDFSLTPNTDGSVTIDTVAGASGVRASHIVLKNMEVLKYSNNSQQIDLTSFFPKTVLTPEIVSYTPANSANNVPTNSPIILKFNETIQAGNGNITIHANSASGSILEAFSVASSKLVSFAQDTLTITPDINLANNTHYFVTIDSGAIQDLSGNVYSNAASYDFTTQGITNHSPTGSVSISGTATQGQTLKATNSLADLDGLGAITYQWKSGDTLLGTGDTYLLGKNDVGKNISVTANYVDGAGTAESVPSSSTSAIAAVVNSAPTVSNHIVAQAATEGKAFNFSIPSNTFSDIDNDKLSFTATFNNQPLPTWLKFTSAGKFSGTPTYAAADTAVNTITVTANDGHGGITPTTFTLNITNVPAIKGTVNADTIVAGLGNDSISGLAGNDVIDGGAGDDNIDGGAGNDSIKGGLGNDTLDGGLGKDTLDGGSGTNYYLFDTTLNSTTNVDKIVSFVHGTDKIELAKTIMKTLGTSGTLDANDFKLSTQALDSSDRIIYNPSNGALFYDSDGSGSNVAVQFAIVGTSTHPTLTNADFMII